jgi:murein DD-endopeptidase MepM/ murein hydrolase activator NlpD
MLRALLALLLMTALGAVGYYFWTASAESSSNSWRARQQEGASAMVPLLAGMPAAVDTGKGAPPASIPHGTVQGATNLGRLGNRQLGLPIANLRQTDLIDTFDQARDGGDRRHEATDILAPRGTAVVAVDDGVIKKLFLSVPGGITIYQYDPTENYCYYYAHLDRYAAGLTEGQQVRRGDVIGYVGTTGNANDDTPHLHFAILQLGPKKEWWRETTPLNAYPVFMSAITASRTR